MSSLARSFMRSHAWLNPCGLLSSVLDSTFQHTSSSPNQWLGCDPTGHLQTQTEILQALASSGFEKSGHCDDGASHEWCSSVQLRGEPRASFEIEALRWWGFACDYGRCSGRDTERAWNRSMKFLIFAEKLNIRKEENRKDCGKARHWKKLIQITVFVEPQKNFHWAGRVVLSYAPSPWLRLYADTIVAATTICSLHIIRMNFWFNWFLVISIFTQRQEHQSNSNSFKGVLLGCHASVIDINWKFPVVTKSLPPQVANVGDTVRFSWIGTHNVHIHPTMDCNVDGRVFVGDQSGTNYTFLDGGTVLFACDFQNHCDRGLYVEFTVLRPGETPPPFTLAPTSSPTKDSGGVGVSSLHTLSTLWMTPPQVVMMALVTLSSITCSLFL